MSTASASVATAPHREDSAASLPYVAVTMCDGAGIGPEVTVAAVVDRTILAQCRPVVVGDAARLRAAAGTIGLSVDIRAVDAVAKIEPGLVQRTIERGHEALVRAGIPEPRIGVAAINPHAGENGLFGYDEEAQKIAPGVDAACANGVDAVGPLPADTLFFLAGRGDYDLVVAMYHDQGHGPVKVLGIEAGVNITVGLPVIRTSVDHGTAFDIAGKNIADSRSMVEALHQAAEMATR